uniref:Uncharacterized protein n=1 Tax=Rhizophora mucronata TaxID=61149 RepID=A0A2P2PEL1_RHIMU
MFHENPWGIRKMIMYICYD